MKVANPRPGVEIKALDVVPGKTPKGEDSDRAAFAVLGITLGTVNP